METIVEKKTRGRPKKTDEEKTWTRERQNEYHRKYYNEKIRVKTVEKRIKKLQESIDKLKNI